MKTIYTVLCLCLMVAPSLFGQGEVWTVFATDPICIPGGAGNLYVADVVSLSERFVIEYDPSGGHLWERSFQNWDAMYYHEMMGLIVAANDSLFCIGSGGDIGGQTIWSMPSMGEFYGGAFDAAGNFYYCVYGPTIVGNTPYAAKVNADGIQQFIKLLPSSRFATGFVSEKFLPFAGEDGGVRVVKVHKIGKAKTMGGGSTYQEETFHSLLNLDSGSGDILLNKQFLKEATIKYKNNGKGTVEYGGLIYPANYLFTKGRIIFGGKFTSTYEKTVNSAIVKEKNISEGRVYIIDTKARVKTIKLAGKGREITTMPPLEQDTISGFNSLTLDDSGNVFAAGGYTTGKTKNGVGNYYAYGSVHRIDVIKGKAVWKVSSSGAGSVKHVTFHPSRNLLLEYKKDGIANAFSRISSANGLFTGSAVFLTDTIVTLHQSDGANYFYATMFTGAIKYLAKYPYSSINTPGQYVNAIMNEPETFSLKQNYPNPFNPTTTIRFTIQEAGFTTLKVYNTLGQEVANLVSEIKEQGEYTAQWNAGAMPSGAYTYRLTVLPAQEGSAPFQSVKTMMLVK